MVDRPHPFSEIPDERDFVIENPTSETLHSAIATFPMELEIGEINLVALRDRREDDYLFVCKRDNIAPHTKLQLDYSGYNYYDARVINMETSRAIDVDMEIEGRKQRAMMLMLGARLSNIKIDTMWRGFAEFNKSIRHSLYEYQYQILSAYFAVTTHSTRDNFTSMGGTFMSTGVEMSDKSLRLVFGECSPEQREQLVEWFEKIREKHQRA